MFSRLLSLFHRCWPAFLLISAFSVYCAAQQPRSVIPSALELADPLGSGWALGDLDGDHETDIALSRDVEQRDNAYFYRVELKLSQGEGSGSFTFANTDALGVNITAVDVDGDHDLDLVINGRFSGQRIGVWINDGRGVFTQNLHNLYSTPEDPVLHSLRVDLPRQAIDENASRRLPISLPHARSLRAVSSPIRVECGTVVHCKFRFRKGQQYLRAPPTPSFQS
jgi:hypothetical protein